MNKLILHCLIAFTISDGIAQTSDQAVIQEIMNKQEVAWNSGDIEGFMQAYWKSDSLLFIGGSGPQYGWQNTLEKYKKSYPDKKTMGILKFENINYEELSQSNVHILGKWQLEREKDTLMGYYTLLWKKLDGEWKIVYDHSSSVKK